MIINRLSAKNFLKYSVLDLRELPAQGMIAISGANESGKTAVVETLCFALFGRTFSLPPDQIQRAIRWGETHAWVELDFQARDGRAYTVTRGLTLEGKQGVRLGRQGTQEILVKGANSVNQWVVELCGFDFYTFVDTVYLAQRENIAPPSPAQTIKAIAGISELEQVATSLEQEIATHAQAAEGVRSQMAGLGAQLETLQDAEATVLRLEADAVQLENRDTGLQTEISVLQQLDSQLEQSLGTLDQKTQRIAQGDLARTAEQWRTQFNELADALSQAREQANSAHLPKTTFGNRLFQITHQSREYLAGYLRLQDLATAYRARLAAQLGELGENPVAATSFPERHAGVERSIQLTRHRRLRIRWLWSLTLLLALLCGGAGALLWLPHWPWLSAPLDAWLTTRIPGWDSAQQFSWLLGSGALLGLLSLLLLGRDLSLGQSLRALRASNLELGQQMTIAREQRSLLDAFEHYTLPDGLMTLDKLRDDEIRHEVRHYVSGPGSALALLDAWDHFRSELQTALRVAFGEFDRRRMDIREAIHQHKAECDDLRTKREQLRLALAKARERRAQASQILLLLSTLQQGVDTHDQAIRIRRIGLDLLRGAGNETARRFNTDLRRFMGRIMPRLTLARYHYLQLDEQLDVNVFSNDKHDFVTLGELSTGTQRQIMLALRLALAEALAEGSGAPQQCLLLDEPFAFFDAERVRQALGSLPTLSERLTQIWLVSQEFPGDAAFSLTLHCDRAQTVLRTPASPAGAV